MTGSALAGRHALVTRAGTGIGAATARAFAGRRCAPLEAVVAELPTGASFVLDGFDVTDAAAVARGAEKARAVFGPVSTGRDGEAARAELANTNSQGRLVTPEEVAEAALWLASPGAESTNGQAITIADGEVMAG